MLAALLARALARPLAERLIFEAEAAVLQGDCTIERELAGYSGTGYVYMHDSKSITWRVTRAESALFSVGFRYATPIGERQQAIAINGQDFGYFMFPDSKVWRDATVVPRVPLRAGMNEITVTKNYGWMYFDYMFLEPYADAPYALADAPVAPGATAPCRELYNFLKATFTKRTIAGAMTLQGGEEYSMVEPNWLQQNTGKYPALVGLDFMHQTGKESAWYYNDPVFSKQVVRDATNYWRRGGRRRAVAPAPRGVRQVVLVGVQRPRPLQEALEDRVRLLHEGEEARQPAVGVHRGDAERGDPGVVPRRRHGRHRRDGHLPDKGRSLVAVRGVRALQGGV
jgi:mannan endo-1,4-beta-mannosidase